MAWASLTHTHASVLHALPTLHRHPPSLSPALLQARLWGFSIYRVERNYLGCLNH